MMLKMNWSLFRSLIVNNLSDDLLTKKYRLLKKDNPDVPHTMGHCYVVSETAYHLLGGKAEGWTPQFIKHLGRSHWLLKHCSGFILDLTADRFQSPVDYDQARGTGFLTLQPSKRAKILIERINTSPIWHNIKNCLRP